MKVSYVTKIALLWVTWVTWNLSFVSRYIGLDVRGGREFFLLRIFQFAKKKQKKIWAQNCAPIFDPLPWAQKSKLGQTKKYTPGKVLRGIKNTKIQTSKTNISPNPNPKVAVWNYLKYWKTPPCRGCVGRVKYILVIKNVPINARKSSARPIRSKLKNADTQILIFFSQSGSGFFLLRIFQFAKERYLTPYVFLFIIGVEG